MSFSHATEAQRAEIKRIGRQVFGADIESEAFIAFSNWLQRHYGIFALQDISFQAAGDVIERLKNERDTNKKTQPPPQTPSETAPKAPQSKKLGLGDPMLRIAAKIYLKGFYKGQIHTKETPPSIDDIVRITKEEMGLT